MKSVYTPDRGDHKTIYRYLMIIDIRVPVRMLLSRGDFDRGAALANRSS